MSLSGLSLLSSLSLYTILVWANRHCLEFMMLNPQEAQNIGAYLQLAKMAKEVEASEIQLAMIDEANKILKQATSNIVEAKIVEFPKD